MSIPRDNWRAVWSRHPHATTTRYKTSTLERDLGPKRPLIATIRALRAETPPDGYEFLGVRNANTWDY